MAISSNVGKESGENYNDVKKIGGRRGTTQIRTEINKDCKSNKKQ